MNKQTLIEKLLNEKAAYQELLKMQRRKRQADSISRLRNTITKLK